MSNIQIEDDSQQISDITAEIIDQIVEEYPRIQSLDFSSNLLTAVENLQRTSATLIAINLSHNHLDFSSGMTSALSHLYNLVQLNLSNNWIVSLQCSGIDKCTKLEDLNLANNRIS
jgi:Leucine-rich repeat (LRR) protein